MLFIVLAVVGLVLYLVISSRRPKNFPPGPRGIPILGNALQVAVNLHEKALESRTIYGNIQSYKFVSKWAFILNHPDDIREAFNRSEFSGRGGLNALLDDNAENANYGVIMSTGDHWHHLRRFTLRTLRDFGFAKRTSENIILEEANDLIEELREKVGEPISTDKLFNITVFNVIWNILAGERVAHDDKRVMKLVNLLDEFSKSLMQGFSLLFFFFPSLVDFRNKYPFLFPKSAAGIMRDNLFEYFREVIQRHRETYQKGQPRDYIDALIEEAEENKDIAEMDFLATLLDFFFAGSETTSATLRWSLFMLAHNPEVQEKIYREIQTVVGDRQVTLADKQNLSYMDHFTQELWRFASVAHVAVPHTVTEDTHFEGFVVPKGTAIVANIYASHHMPEFWGDPENFRPERFADNAVGTRHKAWITFGAGKRQCLGEALAKDEFFLFFTNLVQNFTFSFPENEPRPVMGSQPFTRTVRLPADHQLVVNNRT